MKYSLLKILVILPITLLAHNALAETNSEWSAELLGPNTFFGEETNGVKSALHLERTVVTNGTSINCSIVLKSSHTNVVWLYLPPKESRFKINLFDSKDNPVDRTTKGNRLGMPLAEPFYVRTGMNYSAGYIGLPLIPNQEDHSGDLDFNLRDYFNITKPGKYKLEVQLNLIWFQSGWKGSRMSTNVPIVTFPPIDAQIEVRNP